MCVDIHSTNYIVTTNMRKSTHLNVCLGFRISNFHLLNTHLYVYKWFTLLFRNTKRKTDIFDLINHQKHFSWLVFEMVSSLLFFVIYYYKFLNFLINNKLLYCGRKTFIAAYWIWSGGLWYIIWKMLLNLIVQWGKVVSWNTIVNRMN